MYQVKGTNYKYIYKLSIFSINPWFRAALSPIMTELFIFILLKIKKENLLLTHLLSEASVCICWSFIALISMSSSLVGEVLAALVFKSLFLACFWYKIYMQYSGLYRGMPRNFYRLPYCWQTIPCSCLLMKNMNAQTHTGRNTHAQLFSSLHSPISDICELCQKSSVSASNNQPIKHVCGWFTLPLAAVHTGNGLLATVRLHLLRQR